MLNLPSKALIYRDWKYSKWFILLLFLELFIFCIPGLVFQREFGEPSIDMIYHNGLNVLFYTSVTLALMSVVLFNYDRRLSSYTLAASMPFKRSEIITSKWLVGFYNIAISYFSIYVLMNVMLILNFCWKRYFFDITRWTLVSMLMSFCILGFILMAQSLNGSAIFGVFMTALFAFLPASLIFILYRIFYGHYSQYIIPGFLKPIKESGIILNIFEGALFLLGTDLMNQSVFHSLMQSNLGFIIKGLVFIGLTIIFYILSLGIFKKNKFEMSGYITALGNMGKIYKLSMAYSLCLFMFVAYCFSINGGYIFNPDLVIFFCVILPVPFYFIMDKVIKLYNKRFQ
ncbi:MAG: ABC-2 transporter permease [Bacillota bacterium]